VKPSALKENLSVFSVSSFNQSVTSAFVLFLKGVQETVFHRPILLSFCLLDLGFQFLLPREPVDAPSQEVFKARLDGALSNLV